jgi:polysaccharide export outer membrane protein
MATIMRTLVLILLLALLPYAAHSADYVIGEGDVLMISVWGEKELSLSVKVRPDGKISLPAIGEVAASSMSVKRLQELLTEKFSRIVKNPIVTVIVAEITNNKVYVFGGGVSSGVYSLTQRTTLLQLLCQVGQQQPAVTPGAPAGSSSTRNADLKNAYVLRNGKKVKQGFYKLFVEGDTSEDITIEPNDALFIPAPNDKNVYVMGAVMKPQSIPYRDGLTVMEAILESGGFTKFARQNETIIYRRENELDISIAVKAKNLIDGGDLNQNVRLRPGDYIVVREGIF